MMRRHLFLLGFFPLLVLSDCECGYMVRSPDREDGAWVFADMLETDFTQTEDIATNGDWVRQGFNVTAEAGRGEYGKAFLPDNVFSHRTSATGSGTDAGVQLRVRSLVSGTDMVPVAELDTSRRDLHWGSFRAGMKLAEVEGTCAAFFWYFNDTQEIDMEFLSREFDHARGVYPVHLVIQTRDALAAGFNAQNTDTYKQVNLAFDPTAGFHEYRFDYLPGRVIFYADSEKLAEMEGSAMPSSAGHLILQHWSNGNPQWSGGPPVQDALLTVSYVKAYFSSLDATLRETTKDECSAEDNDGAVCIVPDGVAVNASTGGWFISRDGDPSRNKEGTVGNDGDDSESGAASPDCNEGSVAIKVMAMAVSLVGSIALALL
ncbi:family 16 glycoside hydrolase [Stachybotrys elegans]|uniref:Family 16 glycoside hydrolase n=1 Tax=Stachybotrys elegans TaxID=80388 RepID=A0A8K0SRB0_9HYPO|nr:family 16 glycoside hydrolase [Stachybotrys elegans]